MRLNQTFAECYWATFCYQKQHCKGEGGNIGNCKNHASVPRHFAGIIALQKTLICRESVKR